MGRPPEWARGEGGPAIPGVVVVDQAALRAWLADGEHADHCAARDEGMNCCLDWLAGEEA